MSTLAQRRPIALLLDWSRPVIAPRVRRYAALTFLVDAALIFALLVAVQSYLPEQYGAGDANAGYVLAAYGGAKLLGQFAAGWLIDREGPRRGLIGGLFLTTAGIAAMLFGVVRTEAVIPAAGLYGLGAALIWPSTFALAADEFEEGERARLAAGMTVATGLGVGSALFLGLLFPASFPYAAAIGMSVLASVAALSVATGFRIHHADFHAEIERPHLLVSLRSILTPRRLTFSLMIFLQACILGALLAVFRSYGRDSLQVSMREQMLLLAPAGLAGAFAVVIGGRLADKIGRIPVLGTGFLLVTLGVWGLSATTASVGVTAFAMVAASGLALALPCTGALSMDLSRSAGTGTLLGWFLTMEGAGHAIGPAAAGVINHAGGPAPVLWLVGGLAAIIALLALVPPIWAAPRAEMIRRPFRALFAGTAKGALVFGVGFPIVAVYLAWQPGSQLYGDIVTHGPRDRMEVAITFDDGPNDPWTIQIADTLQHYDVQGTFFTIGQNADVHPEIVRQLASMGELIGNHSYRHHKSDAIWELDYGELTKAESAIARAAGVCPAFYRPPNGFHTPWQLHAVADHDMTTVTWDLIPRDWKDPPSDVIVSRVLDSVQPGSIILLHDGDNTNQGTDRSATLNALPGIISGLREKGYDIVRLDKLLNLPAYLPTCDGAPAT
jgi:peptidoglycan/xylan/chitin deacetylase (PgdA/CDA1 family)/predicted MFS family arabinose efflux permease